MVVACRAEQDSPIESMWRGNVAFINGLIRNKLRVMTNATVLIP